MALAAAQIADAAAEALNLDKEARNRVYATTRALLDAGIVAAEPDDDDARGTRRLDERAGAAFLAVIPLAVAGFPPRALRSIVATLQAPDALTGRAPILRALSAVRAGAGADLFIAITPDFDRPVVWVTTGLDKPIDPESQRILDDAAVPHVAEMRVDMQILAALKG